MRRIKKLLLIIKKYILSLFNRSETKLIPETTSNHSGMELETNLYQNKETEKRDFFVVYENVKKGIINLEDLMIDDLIKVQLMMKNELEISDKKIYITENELNELNYIIRNLEEENKKLSI